MRKASETAEISFFKQSNVDIEFEIFPLSRLFSRQPKLDHSIEKHHRTDFYQIIYITKGRGTHYIDFQPYAYTGGSILFISRGQVHAYEVNPANDGYIIMFTETFLSKNLIHSDILSLYRLYNYHLHRPIIQPEEAIADDFISIIREMDKEYRLADIFAKEEMLRLLLKLLLLRAERAKQTLIPQKKNSEWVFKFNNFRKMVEKHFTETRNANDYAERLNISYKHLNEICKSITGNTAKVFIDYYVILEAKRHLATSNLPIKELTYRLGFDEPTNFVKFFRKHTRQSPSQFKTNLSK